MKHDLEQAQKRVLQYQNIDGTFEFTFGALFLVMAICMYALSEVSLPSSLLSNLLPFALSGIFAGWAFFIDHLAERFRERFTYPRTGYIAYSRQPRPIKRATRLFVWIGVPLLTIILSLLLFLYRMKFPAPPNQESAANIIPGFFGLLFSGLFVIIAWKISLPRYYISAAVTLLVGAELLLHEYPGYLGTALLFSAMSLTLLLTGGATLWRYLHATHPPEKTTSADLGVNHDRHNL